MGRKGVSKRKPSQNKSNSGGGSDSSVSSVIHASESKSVNTFDITKDAHATKGGAKPGSNRKKTHK